MSKVLKHVQYVLFALLYTSQHVLANLRPWSLTTSSGTAPQGNGQRALWPPARHSGGTWPTDIWAFGLLQNTFIWTALEETL